MNRHTAACVEVRTQAELDAEVKKTGACIHLVGPAEFVVRDSSSVTACDSSSVTAEATS